MLMARNGAAFFEQTKMDNWCMVGLLIGYAARSVCIAIPARAIDSAQSWSPIDEDRAGPASSQIVLKACRRAGPEAAPPANFDRRSS